MKFTYLLVFVLGIFLPSISSRHVQFYRKDYTYFEEYDAFYKLHWDINGSSWDTAFMSCDAEGATLFYPKVKDEWTLVKNLTNKMLEEPNVTDIFVGLHDKFALGEFITVDGHSTPYPMLASEYRIPEQETCVTMNILTGAFKVDSCVTLPNLPLPFVCKKIDTEPCPTVDPGYKYAKVPKKCYKLNNRRKTWMEAMETCFMEGGVLAVIESRVEADIITDMTASEHTYYVGVFKFLNNSDYYTVKGQKFTREMYQNYYNYNNRQDSDHVNSIFENYENSGGCGAVYSVNILQMNIVNCEQKLPFICEIESAV